MIVYIAGPMTGYPEFNYPAFNSAEKALEARRFTVLSPVRGQAAPTTGDAKPWVWYMREALALLIQADAVALLPGWEDSRGARLEHTVAHGLGMLVQPLVWWMGRAS